MGNVAIVVATVSFVLAAGSGWAGDICEGATNPELADMGSEAEVFQLHEDDFTTEKAMSSLKHLEEMAARIFGPPDHCLGTETYHGYHNSLVRIRGYILKAQAIAESRPETSERPADTQPARPARDRFCELLRSSAYSD